MKEIVKKGLLNIVGYSNYYRIIDYKNNLLNTKEAQRKKESLGNMVNFYSQFIKKGDLCFDVGANMGNRVEAFLELGARVVAMEPQERCCIYLQKRYGSKIEIVPKGCGEKDEVRDFYISDASTISSCSEEWIQSVKEGRFREHNWNKKVSISLTTLDNLIQKYGVPRFIKIDVEGFEPEVLKGLSVKIPMMSFEYSEPEQHNNTINCLQYLQKINPSVQFNYSTGESMSWGRKDWMNATAMRAFIETPEFKATGFGDIYVRN